jgi:hypothetical protein
MAFTLSDVQISMAFGINLLCGILVNEGLGMVERVEPHAAKMLKSLRMQVLETLTRVDFIILGEELCLLPGFEH